VGVILDDTPDRLGPLTDAANAAVTELNQLGAVSRAWSGDHTLWRDDPTEIADRLGWLTVVPEMVTRLDSLSRQAAQLTAEVDHVLLMGMGGSSLFPEVLARALADGTAEAPAGSPSLHVVDTTDSAAIARLGDELAPERTLHVAASKSGTTLETRSHLAWAWERHPDPARFAVITDPGSQLAELARERGFAAVWENRPDIGGRYSALSLFGLVPGLLAGVDVAGLLRSASAMSERLRASPKANPAGRLAAAMAAGVREGRDKLTIVVPDQAAAFGLWLEQLLAESTGKDGTGIVPVVGEPLGPPDAYGDDRVFVALGDGTTTTGLDALAAAGHPVTVLPFDGELADLGGQVLLWELATALAGALLGIQPFDQPDVAAAKAATAKVLADGRPDLPTVPLSELLDQVQPGDYLAIQAFVDPGSPVVERIEAARVALRDRLRVATTVGLGPRFLHSTGQLHKGGPPSGVFVQVVGDDPADVPIPGEDYGFAGLKTAQADGDLVTLHERKRRAGRVTVDDLLSAAGVAG
jgi:glucose-6-phosphate isomerase